MMDVIHEINTTRREVGTRTLEAGQARTISVSRTYAAEVEDVWDACTNPERIRRWFLPVSGDLREGGHFQVEGNASGSILGCHAPHGFSATWEYGGEVKWIELRLTPEANGTTRFVLEHTVPVNAQWTEFGPGAVGVGWDLALPGLEKHLRTGATVNASEAAAWSQSDEGKEFMRLSSRAWCDASIASGTERELAQAAAERTTAFYTGVPQPSDVL